MLNEEILDFRIEECARHAVYFPQYLVGRHTGTVWPVGSHGRVDIRYREHVRDGMDFLFLEAEWIT